MGKDNLAIGPNIFDYATSELSQDAMFLWLLRWADVSFKQEDESLHAVAQNFLRLMAGNDIPIGHVEVWKQAQNVDIWVEVDGDIALIIEDKVYAGEHGDQLTGYRQLVEEYYRTEAPRSQLFFTYAKTGNEPMSSHRAVEEKGYRYVDRHGILQCLKQYKGNNRLVHYYIDHLEQIESGTETWREKPVSEWEGLAWQGFYMELERHLAIDGWRHVSNPSGGFWGAWWHFIEIENVEMYLQFEESKLCIKITDGDCDDRAELRDRFHRILMEYAKDDFPEIKRPERFGNGAFMTIAVVDSNVVFCNGKVNMGQLVARLKSYENLIDRIAEIVNNNHHE